MNEFEKLVLMMRNEQKLYFKTRNSIHLTKSKQLERSVDKFLAEKSNNQQNLFI